MTFFICELCSQHTNTHKSQKQKYSGVQNLMGSILNQNIYTRHFESGYTTVSIPGDTLDSNDHVRVLSQSCCVCMWNSSWSCSSLSLSVSDLPSSGAISSTPSSISCTSSHHPRVAHSPPHPHPHPLRPCASFEPFRAPFHKCCTISRSVFSPSVASLLLCSHLHLLVILCHCVQRKDILFLVEVWSALDVLEFAACLNFCGIAVDLSEEEPQVSSVCVARGTLSVHAIFHTGFRTKCESSTWWRSGPGPCSFALRFDQQVFVSNNFRITVHQINCRVGRILQQYEPGGIKDRKFLEVQDQQAKC